MAKNQQGANLNRDALEKQTLRLEQALEAMSKKGLGATMDAFDSIGKLVDETAEKVASMADRYGDSNKYVIEMQENMKKLVKYQKSASKEFKAASSILEDGFSSFSNFIESLPGGKYLSKALGIEGLQEDLFDGSKSINQQFNAMGGIIKNALINPLTMTALAVGVIWKGLKMAWGFLSRIEGAATEFRKQTGLTRVGMSDIRTIVEGSYGDLQKFGVGIEEMYQASADLFNTLGNKSLISEKNIKTVSLMTKQLNMTGESAAKLVMMFKTMGGYTDEQTRNLIGSATATAQMLGLSPEKIFSDVANNSEFIYTYMKGSTEQAIIMATKLAAVGLSLADASSVMETMLDFQSSMTSQLQASMLLGQNLNFNEVRRLSAMGDANGAMKEMINQLGSINDLENATPWAKQELSKATGLSIDRIMTTIKLQKELNKVENIGRKQQLENLRKLNSESGASILEQQINQESIEALNNSFKSIGASLAKIFLPAIRAVAWGVSLLSDVVNGLASGFGLLGDGLGTVVSLILGGAGLYVALKLLGKVSGKVLTSMAEGLGSIGKGIGSAISGMFQGLKAAAKAMSDPKIALGMVVVTGVLIGLGYALGLASDGIKALGEAFGTIIEKGGKAIATIVTAVANSIKTISGLGDDLFYTTAALYAMTGALAAFTAVSVGSGLTSLFGSMTDSDPVSKLETLSKLGPGLKETSDALNSIGDIFNSTSTKEDASSKKLDELIKLMKEIKFTVNLDGKKVGTGLSNYVHSYG